MCGLEGKGIGEEVVKSFKENKICGATFLGMSSQQLVCVTASHHSVDTCGKLPGTFVLLAALGPVYTGETFSCMHTWI